MDPEVDRALAAARAQGLEIGDRLGATGYCERWALGEGIVMRVPRSVPAAALGRGDGPFVVAADGTATGVDGLAHARTLFEQGIDRQRGVERGPLARFVDRLELDGVPVALHERPAGGAPTPADVPAIARALAELHATFGYHGHLAPAHVVVDHEGVAFTDPLPPSPRLLGALGYALPIHAAALAPTDEGLLLRDVAALAALAAELHGVDLGWDARFAAHLEHTANRGVGRPWDARPALAELARRARAIADEHVRGWIVAAGRLALDHYLPAPSVRPTSTAPRAAAPGTAHSLLARFDLHAGLGALAAELAASPSLLDFVALERGLPIHTAPHDQPDPAIAFEAREVSFARIAAALPALAHLYGEPPPVEVPPIAHHADVYAETRPLRALLLDVDRLLAPTPATLDLAGGLLARARVALDQLHDPAVRMAAARRYVNYVSNTFRVY